MSENREPNSPSGQYGNWRQQPLVGGPGEGRGPGRTEGRQQPPGDEGPYIGPEGAVTREALEIGHEGDIVNTRPVYIFLTVVALIVGLSFVVTAVMQSVVSRAPIYIGLPQGGIVKRAVQPEDRDLPEGARARAIRTIERQELQAREQQNLENYAWTDKNTNAARVPIERAIDLLLQKGLPSRPNAGSPEPPRPAGSNSGRALDQNK